MNTTVGDALPFGSWPSPVTPDLLVEAAVTLGGPAWASGELWWSEQRPDEGGRVQLVRVALAADGRPAGSPADVLPEGFGARTRVHEYGGGAWWLHRLDGRTTRLFFANWSDQRLYRLDVEVGGGVLGRPVPLTPEPVAPGALRYADGVVTADGRWVLCVRERHPLGDEQSNGGSHPEPANELVAIPVDGTAAAAPEAVLTIVGGRDGPDFVSSPRLAPDGRSLRWLEWNHPDLPWDGAQVRGAQLTVVDGGVWLDDVEPGTGPGACALPAWSCRGEPFVVRETDGWLRLWSDGPVRAPLTPGGWEWAPPHWVFGQSWYAVAADDSGILAVGRREGVDTLFWLERSATGVGGGWSAPVRVDVPGTSFDGLVALDGPGRERSFALLAASFTSEPEVVVVSVGRGDGDPVDPATGSRGPRVGFCVVRPARDLQLGEGLLSVPEHVTFPTGAHGAAVAHAFVYPPRHPRVTGPAGARPPLLVMLHGGPTSAARPQLNLAVQFWTSRGFVVADVNYRGSTGYGQSFREQLDGEWGIADVEDCVAVADYLARRGDVDPTRLAIRGSSAGGFTTLCALTFHDRFAVGTSLYGIGDLETLATDTHKFEARYLDRLVGPYPATRDRYVARSPVHHLERLHTPVLLLQGLDDEVVPPSQAEAMVAALTAHGVPHAYLVFPGEGHGFRQASTIRRAIEAELYFYGHVFGFEPADDLVPIDIGP